MYLRWVGEERKEEIKLRGRRSYLTRAGAIAICHDELVTSSKSGSRDGLDFPLANHIEVSIFETFLLIQTNLWQQLLQGHFRPSAGKP